jgi:hypothetical protein
LIGFHALSSCFGLGQWLINHGLGFCWQFGENVTDAVGFSPDLSGYSQSKNGEFKEN